MEFSFGTGGNLKSARRLRNLDLKKNRPTVHPLFGNTGSVVTQAYAAANSGKSIIPSANSVSVKPPLGGRSALPLKSGNRLINQGIASEQTGELLQPPPSTTAITPAPPSTPSSQPAQAIVQTEQKQGFFSSGKNVVLAGGGLIAMVLIAYMFFGGGGGKKRSGRRRNNSNGNKKARGRRRR